MLVVSTLVKRDPNYSPERYAGRPFLAIMDQFVLSVALETPAETALTLNHFSSVIWEDKGDWRDLVIKHMEFSPTILTSLRQMWESNVQITRDSKVSISPWDFAKGVSGANFVPMMEKLN